MVQKPSQKGTSRPGDELMKENREQMPLVKQNFIQMAVAGAMIVIGFALMAGGASDWNVFNEDIFSVRRIVVGPTVAFLGFLYMGYAIMFSPKEKKGEE